MFNDPKAKIEQKKLEKILKEIVSNNKEKSKIENCVKLIEIFENCLELTINFDFLLQSINDLYESNNMYAKKIWLMVTLIIIIQIAVLIIKFRPDFREKLFDKAIKVIFELKSEDCLIKIKVT